MNYLADPQCPVHLRNDTKVDTNVLKRRLSAHRIYQTLVAVATIFRNGDNISMKYPEFYIHQTGQGTRAPSVHGIRYAANGTRQVSTHQA